MYWLGLDEKIKSGYIESKSSIYVSQTSSPALTKQRAMIAKKEQRRLDPSKQGFAKYSPKSMVRKTG